MISDRSGQNSEQAELYWKWGVRGGLALLLLLANTLLVVVILNASDAFDAIDRVGGASKALEVTAVKLDALTTKLVDDAERVTSTMEQAGDDVERAREVLQQAGEDITRATDSLEEAGVDLNRAANDFERIADALEEAFAQ